MLVFYPGQGFSRVGRFRGAQARWRLRGIGVCEHIPDIGGCAVRPASDSTLPMLPHGDPGMVESTEGFIE
jgi:hypothetical protein